MVAIAGRGAAPLLACGIIFGLFLGGAAPVRATGPVKKLEKKVGKIQKKSVKVLKKTGKVVLQGAGVVAQGVLVSGVVVLAVMANGEEDSPCCPGDDQPHCCQTPTPAAVTIVLPKPAPTPVAAPVVPRPPHKPKR
jgi:hypothetical protein